MSGEGESMTPKKRALLSLSDKSGLDSLGKGLLELGYGLISTGGTAKALEDAGLPVTRVEDLTAFPEMLDGRVKTLHPAVHGGLLARRDLPAHMEALEKHSIGTIDVLIVNLYPFYATVTAAQGTSFENGVENIDIGGPAMLRAAAKNHEDVFVVVDSADYPLLLTMLRDGEDAAKVKAFKRHLAWKAFQYTSSYDSAVAEWLWKENHADAKEWEAPPAITVPLQLTSSLRYGENPHQKAAFYIDKSVCESKAGGIATAILHHGKEMSYNNYLDSDAAWNCASEFVEPTCVVVKHTNPCGVASGDDLLEIYRAAVRADPISAFGGIVAFNVEVTEELAREIREFRSPTDNESRMFYEIVVAPSYTPQGLEVLKGKSKALRILEAKKSEKGRRSLRQIGGGWLLQDADDIIALDVDFTVMTEKVPTVKEIEDVRFAWNCVKHVKSNAITLAKGGRLLGMGSGQPNRAKSTDIALEKAGEEAKGAALASDAFFPFAWGDAVEAACKAGVAVIAQPGGSVRDQDAIDCCNKYGVAMVVTGVRHFRH
eukprot:TRINITY_DN20295_c0_g1_i1.p1 TRINITY_DN20295_c0_g1~~TRINITY_DN20295_c0_g1_i1.p1  ORF type:complete len:638 (+),score=135.48 TRINITY_DN20295_c0_g1_i1:286-1914(+)